MARLALLSLLLPWVVLAQTPPPDAPVAAPPLVPATEAAEPAPPRQDAEPEGWSQGSRMLLEALAGGTGTLLGGAAGVAAAVALTSCDFIEGDCTTANALTLSGIALGAASGTYLAGRLMKGRGRFLGTLIGSSAGTGAGLLLLLADGDDPTMGVLALLLLPGLGAMAGYESTHASQEPPRSSLTFIPVLGPTPRGGFLGGLSGRF